MAEYWARSFGSFYGPRLRLGLEKRQKELGQYSAILTSRLVNNAHITGFLKAEKVPFSEFGNLNHESSVKCVLF